ncbi:MAG: DUF2782 domain-containing protein [Comamonadaceae bacterium]|nr:DUF2782 domain-containing protein [Comamonadaceae bacterium]
MRTCLCRRHALAVASGRPYNARMPLKTSLSCCRFACLMALACTSLLAPAWAQDAPSAPSLTPGDAVVYERVVSRPVSAAVNDASAHGPEAPSPAPGQPKAQTAGNNVRLYQQDAGSRVEELRVRGQTQAITVTPAGAMPAYEVSPGGSRAYQNQPQRAADGTNGPRRWKIGEF